MTNEDQVADPVDRTDGASVPKRPGIVLFSGKEAPGLFESGTMSFPEFDSDDQAAIAEDGPRSPDIVQDVLELRTRTSFGMKIAGGQVDRLRRMNVAAVEHGEQWKEPRAEITG